LGRTLQLLAPPGTICTNFIATVETDQSLCYISIPLKVSNKDLSGILGCGVKGVAK